MSTQPTDDEILAMASNYWSHWDEADRETGIELVRDALARWGTPATGGEPVHEPQEAITDDGWTEFVCPNPASYLMQCCDCGLIHEMQFRVVNYQNDESDEFTVVKDPNLQAQFRARRHVTDGAATARNDCKECDGTGMVAGSQTHFKCPECAPAKAHKPDGMSPAAWRQLTEVIPFRLRQVEQGRYMSLCVIARATVRVAQSVGLLDEVRSELLGYTSPQPVREPLTDEKAITAARARLEQS